MEVKAKRDRHGTRVERIYMIIMLFVMTRPFSDRMVWRGIDTQLVFIVGMYGVLFFLIASRTKAFIYVALLDKHLLLLVAFALVSIVWSDNRQDTLQGSIIFSGATILGIYIALRYSIRDQMGILAWVLGLAAIASFVIGLLVPAMGRSNLWSDAGAWTGIYEHKNALGRVMVLGATLFWVLRLQRRGYLGIWTGLFLCLLLLVLAKSATALVAFAMTLGLMPLYRILRWRSIGARVILLGLGLVLIFSVTAFFWHRPDLFFLALGRDPERNTFLVRISIWREMYDYILKRPILGYGFDAFWGNGRTLYGWTPLGWTTSHAHNGFLEITLQLGIVGLIGMIWHLVTTFRRSVKLARAADPFERLWVFAFLVELVVLNMSYSMLLGQLTMPWVLYVTVSLSMVLQLRRAKSLTRVPSRPFPAPTQVVCNKTLTNDVG